MTPRDRRQQQFARESASRGETEAAISVFRAGTPVHRPTQLTSRRKTRTNSARCHGCDARGAPLAAWQYHDVESGPSVLCDACAATAERSLKPSARAAGKSR